MYKLIIVFLFSLIGHFIFGQSTNDARLRGLDKELDSILTDFHIAGFSIAIVEKNKTLYTKGYGYKDVENKKPVTENTLFAIGSCTKAFTSSLLGILREEGKIDFDKSPRDYLPELKFFNGDMNNLVTVKDMMCHRTGLPRHDVSWYLFPSNSRDSLIKRIEYQEPTLPVRSGWQYNNFMFMAQGAIAEKITGSSWEQLLREKILNPLGMSTTTVNIDQMIASADHSYGYINTKDDKIEKEDYYRIRAMGPAGSINSSAKEMAEWLKIWISNGAIDSTQIIPKIYRDDAISAQMSMGGGPPDISHPDLHMSSYGYGWMMSSYRGHYRVEHGGAIDGFTASTCFFPSDSIGIVVLVNQGGSSAPPIVRNIIADRMLKLPSGHWKTEELKRRAEQKENNKTVKENMSTGKQADTKPSHLISSYTGTFNHPGYGTFNIEMSNDSLFTSLPDIRMYLKHYHFDIFQPLEVKDGVIDTSNQDVPQLLLQFESDLKGDISKIKVVLETGIDPIEFDRIAQIIELDSDNLKKYVGEYMLSGVTAKVYIQAESTLYVEVPGQPPYKLAPTGDLKFTFVDVPGFDLIFSQEDGRITALTFLQPNGNFTAVRKP